MRCGGYDFSYHNHGQDHDDHDDHVHHDHHHAVDNGVWQARRLTDIALHLHHGGSAPTNEQV